MAGQLSGHDVVQDANDEISLGRYHRSISLVASGHHRCLELVVVVESQRLASNTQVKWHLESPGGKQPSLELEDTAAFLPKNAMGYRTLAI
jgi:hypothetical protein